MISWEIAIVIGFVVGWAGTELADIIFNKIKKSKK